MQTEAEPEIFGQVEAQIRNDGAVTVKQVRAYLVNAQGKPYDLPVRYIDTIEPNGGKWSPQWWISDLDHGVLDRAVDVDLVYEYTLQAQLWRQDSSKVVKVGAGKWPRPSVWTRNLSAAWDEFKRNDPHMVQVRRLQAGALIAVMRHVSDVCGRDADEILEGAGYGGHIREILTSNITYAAHDSNRKDLIVTEEVVAYLESFAVPKKDRSRSKRGIFDNLMLRKP
jgi:hypothetical protein